MKKILVPTDFSTPATEAFAFALDLSRITGMEIVVVHAVNLPVVAAGFDVQPYVYTPELNDELLSIAQESFEKMKLHHPSAIKSTLEIRFNSVLDAILDVMSKIPIELIVMGTNGANGMKEILWGSNTERVVRFSPVPVIAVRNAPDIASVRNIIFPSDLELGQGDLVERVKDLQSFFNAKLHLLWVNTPGHFVPDPVIHEKMKEFVNHYHLSNFTLIIRNDTNVESGVASYLHDSKADLVAMGTHGRKGLNHLFSGSVAEDVVNHIQCPVWTYSTHK
ncbi:MAG: universal stress protein [Bacteroidota bacterium]